MHVAETANGRSGPTPAPWIAPPENGECKQSTANRVRSFLLSHNRAEIAVAATPPRQLPIQHAQRSSNKSSFLISLLSTGARCRQQFLLTTTAFLFWQLLFYPLGPSHRARRAASNSPWTSTAIGPVTPIASLSIFLDSQRKCTRIVSDTTPSARHHHPLAPTTPSAPPPRR